jgi:chromosome segregation ATPase
VGNSLETGVTTAYKLAIEVSEAGLNQKVDTKLGKINDVSNELETLKNSSKGGTDKLEKNINMVNESVSALEVLLNSEIEKNSDEITDLKEREASDKIAMEKIENDTQHLETALARDKLSLSNLDKNVSKLFADVSVRAETNKETLEKKLKDETKALNTSLLSEIASVDVNVEQKTQLLEQKIFNNVTNLKNSLNAVESTAGRALAASDVNHFKIMKLDYDRQMADVSIDNNDKNIDKLDNAIDDLRKPETSLFLLKSQLGQELNKESVATEDYVNTQDNKVKNFLEDANNALMLTLQIAETNLGTRVDELKNKSARLEEKVTSLENNSGGGFGDSDSDTKALNASLQKVKSDLNKFPEATEIQQAIDDLETQKGILDSVKETVVKNGDDVQEALNDISPLKNRLTSAEGRLNNFEGRIEASESQQRVLTDSYQTVKSSTDALKTNIEELSSSINVNKLSSDNDITALTTRVTKEENHTATFKRFLDLIGSTSSSPEEKVNLLTKMNDGTGIKFQVEQNTQKFSEYMTINAGATQKALQNGLDTVGAKDEEQDLEISTIKNSDSVRDSSITDLKTRLATAESDIRTNQENIASNLGGGGNTGAPATDAQLRYRVQTNTEDIRVTKNDITTTRESVTAVQQSIDFVYNKTEVYKKSQVDAKIEAVESEVEIVSADQKKKRGNHQESHLRNQSTTIWKSFTKRFFEREGIS